MPKRLQVYEADSITVTFDPDLCIHSRECVRHLPDVFDPARARWIRPDRATAEQVAEAVARCPSGALRARRSGVPEPAPPETVTSVRVSQDGPLCLRGPLRIENEDGELIARMDAAALCRCGGTVNPPFCDGSHERLGVHRG